MTQGSQSVDGTLTITTSDATPAARSAASDLSPHVGPTTDRRRGAGESRVDPAGPCRPSSDPMRWGSGHCAARASTEPSPAGIAPTRWAQPQAPARAVRPQ